jgi:aminopeptidase N
MRAKHIFRTVLGVVGAGVLVVSASQAGAGTATSGAAGAGDPYFPRQGNGGYRVEHYGLSLDYRPATHQLSGRARIVGHATQDLSRFDLDLRHFMHVDSVRVNGTLAAFAQPTGQVQELVITPANPLAKDQSLVVVVRYGGTARAISDPDGSPDGFIITGDGAMVANEPQGAPTWFPVNDTPRDKATYRVRITVPHGLVAVSNGMFLGKSTNNGRTTWRWGIGKPISSYLVTATLGRFTVRRGTTASGIPYFNAFDPAEQTAALPVVHQLPKMIDFFSTKYGKYPFGWTGAIVDHARFVGYALETATRPVFDRAPDVLTLAHELAHQWFGDDVTLRHWRDIWLNEGFAEFSDWLWDEHRGGMTAHQRLQRLLAHPASDSFVWLPPPARPRDGADIFDNSVYARGAGALQALRQKLGSPTFFRILRGWAKAHRYGNASVPEFTAYAAQVSGRDLHHFFHQWLYKRGKPFAS